MVITLFFLHRHERECPALANPLKSQNKSKEYRSKMIRLTKARSLAFYKAFAVETQRGYSEKWTQGPTDHLEYSLEVNSSFLQKR